MKNEKDKLVYDHQEVIDKSLNFKKDFNSDMENIIGVKVDLFINNPQNPKMSLLIPDSSECYKKIIELSKQFVNENL
jgi:hypothetical protein